VTTQLQLDDDNNNLPDQELSSFRITK